MDSEQTGRLTTLLNEAEQAHAGYEAIELNGVPDAEWAAWYGSYIADHGLAAILGHDAPADRLGAHLATAYAEFEAADPTPDESWAEYIARRWPAEL